MDSFVILGSSPQDSLIESQIIENTNLLTKSVNQQLQSQPQSLITSILLDSKTSVDENKNNSLKNIDAAMNAQLNMMKSNEMTKSNQMESFNMSLACEFDKKLINTEKNDEQQEIKSLQTEVQQQKIKSLQTDVQLTNPEMNSIKSEKNSINANQVSSIAENIIMGTLDPKSLMGKNLSFLSKTSLEQKQCFEGMFFLNYDSFFFLSHCQNIH